MPRTDRDPNINDVAALAGVSSTTVSRVLNNRGYLSVATKQRVAEAMDELNYRPNEVARSLFGQRTRSIGVIVPTVALPFFGELVVGIEHSLAMRGYRALLCNSLGYSENERDYLKQLESNRVDGLITSSHNAAIPEYLATRLPVVAVDRDLGPDVPNFRADNLEGARTATELLLRRGSRRPALITSSTGTHNHRETGYRNVLTEAGIEPLVEAVKFGLPESQRHQLIGKALDSLPADVDGVFATDDLSACSVVAWARRQGRTIPDDFRVIGFDGTPAVRAIAPWLTTIQQPIKQIAQAAVDALITQIAETDVRKCSQTEAVEFPVNVIEGETA